jgi:hypothetical protein
MKFIKLFIISVVVLFLLLTAFSSLLPSKVRISRAIDITDSPANVILKIRNMKEWELWNEYIKALQVKDVTIDSIHSKALSVLFISADNVSIKTSWRHQSSTSFPGIFNVVSNKSQTTVQWYFEFSIKWYPWEKFGSIIYDKELGPQMEKSLKNLKQMLEKAP